MLKPEIDRLKIEPEGKGRDQEAEGRHGCQEWSADMFKKNLFFSSEFF